jgi:hypothetical protein
MMKLYCLLWRVGTQTGIRGFKSQEKLDEKLTKLWAVKDIGKTYTFILNYSGIDDKESIATYLEKFSHSQQAEPLWQMV